MTRSGMFEVARFGLVGVLATGLHFAVLALLHSVAGVPPVGATVVAFLVALQVSYFGQRLWVFRQIDKRSGEALRFAGVACVGVALNAGSMALIVGVLGASYVLGFLVGTVAVPTLTFLVNKFWVFGVTK